MPSVAENLESARQQLLDFGLRNNLINFFPLKSKGLEIVGEDPSQVFRTLVLEEKEMSFASAPLHETGISKETRRGARGLIDSPEPLTVNQKDSCLQTPYTKEKLDSRLKNTIQAAQTSLQEQGVNILFLALGMLDWYEAETSDVLRQAPLVLVPAELSRRSIQSNFRVRFSGEEIGGNLSMQAKLKIEFGVVLPDLEDTEELDLPDYFARVQAAVKHIPRSDLLISLKSR